MFTKSTFAALLVAVFCFMAFSAADSPAKYPDKAAKSKDLPDPQRVLVIDGSPVHNVGELLLHTGNWGAMGSRPNTALPYSGAPSAEYPAGSGVEFLYEAGLWVGALKQGVPSVSTSSFEMEFLPTADSLDVVYYAAEGDPGGARLPDANADDDADGSIDEEWLDGHDNDGDGFVDEDFAAISTQMLSCWYSDTTTTASQIYPEHNPLGLVVRQRSFQWDESPFEHFIGFEYTVTNVGDGPLDDVYVGLFVDPDVGDRDVPNYYMDDACGFEASHYECTMYGRESLQYAYAYDFDGDAGQTPGQLGVLILDHPTDPAGVTAPDMVRFSSFQHYVGTQSYQNGGDPTNDFERYESMSSEAIDANTAVPNDIRFMVCSGPFSQLLPGESLTYKIAVFAGNSLSEVRSHAAIAKTVFGGAWFDLDDDPTTGVGFRETPVYGPANDVVVDPCAMPPVVIPFVPDGSVVWTNADCAQENSDRAFCGYSEADSARWATGILGRETQIPWTLPYDVPVPVMLKNFTVRAGAGAAVLSWDLYTDEALRGFRILRSGGGREVVLPRDMDTLPPKARSFEDNSVKPGQRYHYTLIALREDGSAAAKMSAESTIPGAETALHQNYPNPFNPVTTISFTLAEKSAVKLSIYTIEGKRVVTLVDGILPAGLKEVRWNGQDAEGTSMSAGVYFYRLEAGKQVETRKMVLLK